MYVRGLRLLLVIILTGVLFLTGVVGQLVLGMQLTVFNAKYLVDEAHRQGIFAAFYAGAAGFIADEKNELSAADKEAARTALRRLIDDQVLETMARDASAMVSAFMAGDVSQVVLDLAPAKARIQAEFRAAGGSEQALARLADSLAESEDTVVLMDGGTFGYSPLNPIEVWRSTFKAVTVAALLILLVILVAGGLAHGMVWGGAGLAASAALLLSLLGRARSAITAGSLAYQSPLRDLPLDSRTIMDLETGLADLATKVIGQLSIVPWVTVIAGLGLVVAGLLLVRRRDQANSRGMRGQEYSPRPQPPATGAPPAGAQG